MGGIFDVPQMVAGMTMLAWGNCVDNVFATIGLAKAGEFGVAITGIYAAPMFNVLFGNGFLLLIMTIPSNWAQISVWQWQTPFIMPACPKFFLIALEIMLLFTLLFT